MTADKDRSLSDEGVPTPVGRGNTFISIDVEVQRLANLQFAEFVNELMGKAERTKKERAIYFERLRSRSSYWANNLRFWLAGFGVAGFVLTIAASVARFQWETSGADKLLLIAALMFYAVMGAISAFDRWTDKTTTYFRHVGVLLSIRDLWTKLQFEVLRELTALGTVLDETAEPAARQRIQLLVEAFSMDADKISNTEQAEWRTELLASRSELEAVSKQGVDTTTAGIQESIKAAAKFADEAKAAAERAETAAKIAADAGRPGSVNLTIVADFDDEVTISVDGRETAKSTGTTIALEHVATGMRKISARALKGAKVIEAAVMVEIKPGLQDVRIALG
ncbi:MAG: hypothetical protein JWL61_2339 [Gemmatimonadetes bacterium]|nr:hypothetical protein [Gemmatimonadota bacterium]